MVIDLLICSLVSGEIAQKEVISCPPFLKNRHGLQQREEVKVRTHENYMVM